MYRIIKLRRFFLAPHAVQFHAQPAGSALGGHDPITRHPGRLVSDVLGMAAFQIGHPVPLVVLMVTHDLAFHGVTDPFNFELGF